MKEIDCWKRIEEIVETSEIPTTSKVEELLALIQYVLLKRRLEQ